MTLTFKLPNCHKTCSFWCSTVGGDSLVRLDREQWVQDCGIIIFLLFYEITQSK